MWTFPRDVVMGTGRPRIRYRRWEGRGRPAIDGLVMDEVLMDTLEVKLVKFPPETCNNSIRSGKKEEDRKVLKRYKNVLIGW